ncbi:transporter substrate-binding domain-containing protein [Crenobacter cavernae]|uniref:ABC transporter substrate-binding protein n=1 Tax=Crenobacter cavernae TaxID=2290923 RepID=A0ABY0FIH6_9NEIS|nr:transporter substrate-binding domain-containing protein [Crenobacter cavernae]RXZ45461.1 ABC transporter substrate-binding protein [Crenobacter cavernae]
MKTSLRLALAVLALPCAAQAAEPIKIATDATYPPFEYIDAAGKLAGFEVDLANALCKEMNTPCEVVNQPWDGLIPGLSVKKFDAIMASMNITEERKKAVDFSKVYYFMQNRFVAKKGASSKIDAAAMKSKAIAVQTGTPQERFVTREFGKSATIKRYVNAQDPMLELASGRVDYTFGNTVQLQKGFLETQKGQGFEFVGPVFDGRRDKVLGEGVAVALRKNDGELKARFDKAIDAVKQKGIFQQLLQKHGLKGLLEG